MGSASNTMFFSSGQPGDITQLMAQASLALQGATGTAPPSLASVVPGPAVNGGWGFGGNGGGASL